MPVDGRASLAERRSLPDLLADDAIELGGVELLHVFYEAPRATVRDLLPPALHPTIPGALYATFLRCASSPWGPFTLAEVRLAARLREKPWAYLVAAAIDGPPGAARALAAGWGFGAVPAEVRLRRWYDRVEGEVVHGGRPVVRAALGDPEPIPGATLQYGPVVNAALVEGEPRLVFVDAVVTFGDDRQRGQPRLDTLDAGWAGAGELRPTVPIGAYYATADVRLPSPTAIADPDAPSGAGVAARGS